MKKKLKLFSLIALFILAMSIAVPSHAASVFSMKKLSTKCTIYTGSSRTLKVKKYSSKKGKWTSSKKSVATVDKKGKVTAKKPGKVVIKCRIYGRTYRCTITVKQQKVTSLKTSKTMAIYRGLSKKLTVTVSPTNAYNKKVTYTSSNSNVAVVSQTGVVSGINAGTAKITVKAKDGSGKSATCTVTVIKDALSFASTSVKTYVGKTTSQMPTWTNGTISSNQLTFTSSNSSIATVSATGVVTGVKKGIVTIKAASVSDPSVSASYTLQVFEVLTKNSLKFVAHRGLSAQAPENTARAFTLAGQAGFWGAETDVRVTKDGEFILLHDDTFKRLCGVDKKPEDMTLAEIKNLKYIAGNNLSKYSSDESAIRICTLTEYLNICKAYNMVPVIEIKIDKSSYEKAHGTTVANGTSLQTFEDTGVSTWHQLMCNIDDTVRSVMGNDSYTYISFSGDVISEMSYIRTQRQESGTKLQFLFSSKSSTGSTVDNYLSFCKLYGAAWNFQYYEASASGLITKARNAGLEVNVWTVNTKSQADILNYYNVDYITTDKILW